MKAETDEGQRKVFNLKNDIAPRLIAECGRIQAERRRRYTPTDYVNDLLEKHLPKLLAESKAPEPKPAKLVRAVGR